MTQHVDTHLHRPHGTPPADCCRWAACNCGSACIHTVSCLSRLGHCLKSPRIALLVFQEHILMKLGSNHTCRLLQVGGVRVQQRPRPHRQLPPAAVEFL